MRRLPDDKGHYNHCVAPQDWHSNCMIRIKKCLMVKEALCQATTGRPRKTAVCMLKVLKEE